MSDALARFDQIRALRWQDDGLALLDQRLLPGEETWLHFDDAAGVAEAIRALVVRGAPAIGISAAYGVVLAAQAIDAGKAQPGSLIEAMAVLRASRPTAVNLFWALDRMQRRIDAGADSAQLLAEARAIEAEDLAANRCMAQLGAELVAPGSGVLTHCNTGSLATAGLGTALGVIRAGVAAGSIEQVFATETRPWLQGARLTVWELLRDGIGARLIADSAAAHLMATGQVQWLIVGADRIVANGDVANKIGTSQLAICARHHGVRVMVVAPSSTVDFDTASGADIDIELRNGDELLSWQGKRVVAEGVQAWNPVFDVTPAELIDAIVTERGIVRQPDLATMQALRE